MRMPGSVVLLLLLLCSMSLEQAQHREQESLSPARPPWDVKVHRFDVVKAVFRDGLSELSSKNIDGLHLGFEEILRDNIQDDPLALGTHFSLHLEDKTVREI